MKASSSRAPGEHYRLVASMREKKQVKKLCVSVTFILCYLISVKAQDEPSLGLQIRQAVKAKEPAWKFIAGIESGRVPVVPGERTVLVGEWRHNFKNGRQENIDIHVYRVESQAEAIKWLKPIADGQVAAGWRIDGYKIGAEGYLATFQAGKRFGIYFRSGNVVGSISGDNLNTVERFAKHVISQIRAT